VRTALGPADPTAFRLLTGVRSHHLLRDAIVRSRVLGVGRLPHRIVVFSHAGALRRTGYPPRRHRTTSRLCAAAAQAGSTRGHPRSGSPGAAAWLRAGSIDGQLDLAASAVPQNAENPWWWPCIHQVDASSTCGGTGLLYFTTEISGGSMSFGLQRFIWKLHG
jgi:hypothetical protein